MNASFSTPPNTDNMPVIVRVKQKPFQSRLDALWLEIHERPLKRPLQDFGKLSISDASSTSSSGLEIYERQLKRPLLDIGKLSISDASSSSVEELKTTKVLVQHVETVTSSEDTFDVLQRFFKTLSKQDQLLVKAKQRQRSLSRHAHFEQIWRTRKGKKEAPKDEAVYEMCRLYDVIWIDTKENEVEMQRKRNADLDNYQMMAQYLPLLKEVLPTAVVEIAYDIHMSKQDGFVYDFYAVREDDNVMEADSSNLFPLVQVEDDDFYDGPDDPEYESDDSNDSMEIETF